MLRFTRRLCGGFTLRLCDWPDPVSFPYLINPKIFMKSKIHTIFPFLVRKLNNYSIILGVNSGYFPMKPIGKGRGSSLPCLELNGPCYNFDIFMRNRANPVEDPACPAIASSPTVSRWRRKPGRRGRRPCATSKGRDLTLEIFLS